MATFSGLSAVGFFRALAPCGQVVVRRRALQETDGQGLVDAVAHAGLLAGVRAGAADDAGKDASLADEIERFSELVVADQFDVSRDVELCRAGLEAGSRNGRLVGPRGAFLPPDQGEEIVLVVPDGIEYGGNGRGATEVALGELHDTLDDPLDLRDILLLAFPGDEPLQECRQLVDTDAADRALAAGQLPCLLQVGKGQRRDIGTGIRDDHAVPAHQGREGLVAQHLRDAGINGFRRFTGAVVYDFSVPAAEGYCTHSLSPYLSVFCFRRMT